MAKIRLMNTGDLRRVNLTLSKAFTHTKIQEGLSKKSAHVPPVRLDFLEMYLSANPEGCFVAEDDDKVVAFCFSRRWGKTGWLGPLSVLPSHQNSGIGKAIVKTGIETLKKAGVCTLGLEMVAGSPRNLAFYSRLGFRPVTLTVDLFAPIEIMNDSKISSHYTVNYYHSLEKKERLDFIRSCNKLSNSLQAGLDYSKEIELVNQFKFGDACLIKKSDAIWGFILAHTEPYSSEEPRQFLKVNILQLAANLPVRELFDVLVVLKHWAMQENLTRVYLRVPLSYYPAFEYLLTMGFKLLHTDLRLTLNGFDLNDSSAAVNFSKWE